MKMMHQNFVRFPRAEIILGVLEMPCTSQKPKYQSERLPKPPNSPRNWKKSKLKNRNNSHRVLWREMKEYGRKREYYLPSSDPHHGIQFIPSDILSGKSSGILSLSVIFSDILFGISIWHIFLAFHLSYLLAFYLSGISFWHSIWHVF